MDVESTAVGGDQGGAEMLTSLKKLFVGRSGGAVGGGQELGEYIYEVKNPATGEIEFHLSFISPDHVFERGMPGQAVLGLLTAGPDHFDREHFVPNRLFREFYHEVLAGNVARCPDLIEEAKRRKSGHIFIIDPRTPTPNGDVPPEDIVGAVAVDDGEVAGYEGNPNFEVYGANGPMRIGGWWRGVLVDEIRKIAETAD
jgi:hypothetical protein